VPWFRLDRHSHSQALDVRCDVTAEAEALRTPHLERIRFRRRRQPCAPSDADRGPMCQILAGILQWRRISSLGNLVKRGLPLGLLLVAAVQVAYYAFVSLRERQAAASASANNAARGAPEVRRCCSSLHLSVNRPHAGHSKSRPAHLTRLTSGRS
jgi:hypothetical protein